MINWPILRPVIALNFVATTLFGCASGPPKLVPSPRAVATVAIDKPLRIVTRSGTNVGTPNSTTVSAGNLFLSVPKGDPISWGAGIRKLYGMTVEELTEIQSNV